MEDTTLPLTTPPASAEPPEQQPTASAGLDADPAVVDESTFSTAEMLGVVPETVRTYLLSDEIGKKRSEIYEKFGLTEEERTIVLQTELEVFFGLLPLAEFTDQLWRRLPWKDEEEPKAKELIIEILGKIFLTAQAWIGDVVGVLADLGADLKQFPQDQLEMREVSYVEGAKEIADSVDVGPLSDDMRKRLMHIVENRLRNVRDDMETEEMMTKAKKTGGMELPPEQARAITEMVQNKTRMTRFVEQVIPKVASEQPAGSVQQYTPEQIKRLYVGTPEEQKAIALRTEEIMRETGKDPGRMRDRLHEALKPADLGSPEPLGVVAATLVLAQEGILLLTIEDDDRFKSIVRGYLEQKGRDEEVTAFDAVPREPKFINLFLQILLRGYAGLNDSDSARLGLRILGILRKQGRMEYGHLAAFDLEKGKFAWTALEEL